LADGVNRGGLPVACGVNTVASANGVVVLVPSTVLFASSSYSLSPPPSVHLLPLPLLVGIKLIVPSTTMFGFVPAPAPAKRVLLPLAPLDGNEPREVRDAWCESRRREAPSDGSLSLPPTPTLLSAFARERSERWKGHSWSTNIPKHPQGNITFRSTFATLFGDGCHPDKLFRATKKQGSKGQNSQRNEPPRIQQPTADSRHSQGVSHRCTSTRTQEARTRRRCRP
jgi:hypothetical protein